MIGRLTGLLISKQPPEILIDVQGVGYEVQMPMTCLYELPDIGEQVTVVTHFVVREDAQLLYGFNTFAERGLFRQLIKAQGVGPKLALTIMSGMTLQQFVTAVSHDDVSSLVKLPGVGRKTAERLVVEMRDRLQNWTSATPATDAAPIDFGDMQSTVTASSPREDATGALMALGYKPAQAEKAVAAALKTHGEASSEELIRAALKTM
ncbi:Holliday junction branch migration protein RuvA [Pseudidiomarina terrestris]|uniref:Holliday junction branch migration complex subunit RuvA n=1 Tax=Pseudidiomarina terrestris TaxID=2820060 RepID=A0AAW7R049_9GAMM|nr:MULTISPECIES: Holliday junction branch migration protein RuvA [unclassified Pseudidiomarina]MDN7124629.1 Holliday junction branch migration protein RuvA [Pseudidiomarina sp. 1APP75-32.1]MDN7126825.1 Holliday junction branch migration protein RuvA [Pseudidiomarina sp. 1APR75-33.1]MDN7129080.1 Holliday junction branch migration protein RuvA [Pseudidiomarina sp. 1APR75-15]MDN7134656.1 Holliday junction branch migration protein RuvA [Pseudidiomarina sp. 1ASP75-5]MDN7136674.1 Holliday junction b